MEQYGTSSSVERLALGLGVFSIGLGLAEVIAPGRIAQLVGVAPDPRTRSTLRALGAREIGHGVAILTQRGDAWPVWTRVAGDALDVSLLGAAMKRADADTDRTAFATASVLGVAAADVLCAMQLSRKQNGARRGAARAVHVHEAITINRPLGEVYSFWRNFENFPRFMRHLESVRSLDDRRSAWRAKGPAGMTVGWEAEMIDDRENVLIAWQSLEGSDVPNSGSVRFEHAPGARGTEVHVQLRYAAPAGRLGITLARLLGRDPERQIRDDLRRFKQLMEAGEITISDGPGLRRPAQPPERPEEIRALVGVES